MFETDGAAVNTPLDADQILQLFEYSAEIFRPESPGGTWCPLCLRRLHPPTANSPLRCEGIPSLHSWEDVSLMLDELAVVIPREGLPVTPLNERLWERWIQETSQVLHAHRNRLGSERRRSRVRQGRAVTLQRRQAHRSATVTQLGGDGMTVTQMNTQFPRRSSTRGLVPQMVSSEEFEEVLQADQIAQEENTGTGEECNEEETAQD